MMITPEKNTNLSAWKFSEDTAAHSYEASPQLSIKQKMLALMTENTELKGRQKSLKYRIDALEETHDKLKSQVQQFLFRIKCNTLTQARHLLQSATPKKLSPCPSPILQMLANIQSTRTVSNTTNKYYQLAIQSKMEEVENKYEAELLKLKKDNKKLVRENQCLLENSRLIENANSKLRDQLNRSIQKYEGIQAIVNSKLSLYVDKIKEYEEIIKKQRADMHQFSFGKDSEPDQSHDHKSELKRSKRGSTESINNHHKPESQDASASARTDEQDLSAECYRASIEGLLDENRRLKKSFLALYRMREGQSLPEEVVKQIHIMNSILMLNENQQPIQST